MFTVEYEALRDHVGSPKELTIELCFAGVPVRTWDVPLPGNEHFWWNGASMQRAAERWVAHKLKETLADKVDA